MTGPTDPERLSDRELGNLIRGLQLEIAQCQGRLESPDASRQRSIKILRGAILNVGGILGASFEPISAILVILGCWDWIDAIRDDVNSMNQQLVYQRVLAELYLQLEEAELELEKRIARVRSP